MKHTVEEYLQKSYSCNVGVEVTNKSQTGKTLTRAFFPTFDLLLDILSKKDAHKMLVQSKVHKFRGRTLFVVYV